MIMKAQTGMRMPPTGFISKEKPEQQKACCCEWEQLQACFIHLVRICFKKQVIKPFETPYIKTIHV